MTEWKDKPDSPGWWYLREKEWPREKESRILFFTESELTSCLFRDNEIFSKVPDAPPPPRTKIPIEVVRGWLEDSFSAEAPPFPPESDAHHDGFSGCRDAIIEALIRYQNTDWDGKL